MAEPYKIKEVKKTSTLQPYERWNILKAARFNTFYVLADHISFDMVARAMSGWSHFQKAALMIGDEAYAGARSYHSLQSAVSHVLGIPQIVPAHNALGCEKLVATVFLREGQAVLHNRGRTDGLVPALGGESVDLTTPRAAELAGPEQFGGDFDLDRLKAELERRGDRVAYVHAALSPSAWGNQPVSLSNLASVKELCSSSGVRLVVDISNVMDMAWWALQTEASGEDLLQVARKTVQAADIVMMDASEDARSDVGGFVAATDTEAHEALRNQVVVFEGLHTYGGMTGRAMDVFAVGLGEMAKPEMTDWYQDQVGQLHEMLTGAGVPCARGTKGVSLDVGKFLPHLGPEDHPKFALAAALYVGGGIRPRIDGGFAWHAGGPGAKILCLEVPRCAYTHKHLRAIADEVASVWNLREEIVGLRSIAGDPAFVDEARFEAAHERISVFTARAEGGERPLCEPYKIAIFEPLKVTDREFRRKAMAEAGYNTFLLNSEDIYIDLLTDSGTSAMSCHQWEGMTDTSDTPYHNSHTREMVETFQEMLGFDYVIPTHQGRAAEHIMSQTMIEKGQVVPGNMYFTTTKLHQEMAGGVFRDVIVDEAHDPLSTFPWKGNIDLEKVQAEIDRVGGRGIAYISFECSVNMAGGQPFSMRNLRDLSRLCQKHDIPIMFDATRCVENALMIKWKEEGYAHRSVREIVREMMSYGDGCTISCKKDFLVNMGGILACNSRKLRREFQAMLRTWEGEITNGGMDTKDIVALTRGLLDALDDDYIQTRIAQTQEFGRKLIDAGVPIVLPPGSHAIFVDAKRFLPHIDQDEYPAQALAAAIYIETGVRTMERGNVSKGRNPETGENYRPPLELVRCTIPRRVYTSSHMDFVVEGIKRLYEKRDEISGLRFAYEPKVLRFFQGRFEPLKPWEF